MSTPYSFSCKKYPKDAEDLLEAALGAAHAIKQIHGTPFTVSLSAALRIQSPTHRHHRPAAFASNCTSAPSQPLTYAGLASLTCFYFHRASGNVVDYMYAKAGIKFSYSVHLRDTGTVRSSVSLRASAKLTLSRSTASPSPRNGSGQSARRRRA